MRQVEGFATELAREANALDLGRCIDVNGGAILSKRLTRGGVVRLLDVVWNVSFWSNIGRAERSGPVEWWRTKVEALLYG